MSFYTDKLGLNTPSSWNSLQPCDNVLDVSVVV